MPVFCQEQPGIKPGAKISRQLHRLDVHITNPDTMAQESALIWFSLQANFRLQD